MKLKNKLLQKTKRKRPTARVSTAVLIIFVFEWTVDENVKLQSDEMKIMRLWNITVDENIRLHLISKKDPIIKYHQPDRND
jgi:hypothetical protein